MAPEKFVTRPFQDRQPMPKITHCAKSALRTAATSILLLGVVLSSGCRTRKCWEGFEELADSPAGEPYYCDWVVIEQSGPTPNWQTGSSKNGTRYVGEGIHKFKGQAKEKAELAMREQVARGTRYDISTVQVLRETTDGKSETVAFSSNTTGSTNITVSIPPDGVYWDYREREGYQHGTPILERVYRVWVMAEVK